MVPGKEKVNVANRSLDLDALESCWQASKRRREMHAVETERLEGEQDRIEFELGRSHSPLRRWSGTP